MAIIATQREHPDDPIRLLAELVLWMDDQEGEPTPARRSAALLAIRDFLQQRPGHEVRGPTDPPPRSREAADYREALDFYAKRGHIAESGGVCENGERARAVLARYPQKPGRKEGVS